MNHQQKPTTTNTNNPYANTQAKVAPPYASGQGSRLDDARGKSPQL